MKIGFRFLVSVAVICVWAQTTTAPQAIQTNTWVATDALGRKVAEPGDANIPTAPRANRWVGMFYYIWHGYHGNTIYDNTQLLQANPTNPAFGPQHAFHYWGEPEAGYYRSNDPWVIRRNMQMLASAGIDFIHFDLTNAVTYDSTVHEVCRVIKQMRADGVPAPSVSASTWSSSGQTINYVYDHYYNNGGACHDVWFYWNGKPLIFGNPSDAVIRPEVADTFAIKYSWAWTDATNQPDQWQWLDNFPQKWGWSGSLSNVDQMPVSTAQHPTSDRGKSYLYNNAVGEPPVDAYGITAHTDSGVQFEQQWSQVHNKDPKVTMVTQWNEYMAQRFICNVGGDACPNFLGQALSTGQSFFVDAYNREFNRDIEPMKGGWTDNYYYQLVSHVRQVKGISAPAAASAPNPIVIDGNFSDWTGVQPVYMDWQGDVVHRNYPSVDPATTYVDSSGRNDIVKSLTALGTEQISFYSQAAANLTPSTDSGWMVLLIDVDRNKNTGWFGYDWRVSGAIQNGMRNLEKWNGTRWVVQATISAATAGKALELSVPRGLLGLTKDSVSIEFKWCDNCGNLQTLDDLTMHGDAAPDRRWNYFFNSVKSWLLPAQAKSDLTPGVIERHWSFSGSTFPAYNTTPIDSGTLASVAIPANMPATGFALRFDAWLNVPTSGNWTFVLTSDDGSRMSVDDNLIINNDGVHGMIAQQDSVGLAQGLHHIVVDYFQSTGGEGLTLQWSGPSTALQAIPASALWRANTFNIPYAGPIAIPGILEAENFDFGGEGVAYHDADTQNHGGLYRPREGVDIGANDSGYAVGWVAAGEWLNYTVQVATAGSYQFAVRSSSPTGTTGGLSIWLDGKALGGPYNIPNTGAYTTFGTSVLDTFALIAGSHLLELRDVAAGFNLDRIITSTVVPASSSSKASSSSVKVSSSSFQGTVAVRATASEGIPTIHQLWFDLLGRERSAR